MDENIGQDIASLCSKCGESWHVVISKVGDKIAKVECKQCHGVHRYRDPAGPAKARSKKATQRKRVSKKVAGASVVEPAMDRPIKDYSMQGSFETGDRILHSSFGEGVVQCLLAPGKIEVLFGEDRKLLAQRKG